jgi:hypothetical protein
MRGVTHPIPNSPPYIAVAREEDCSSHLNADKPAIPRKADGIAAGWLRLCSGCASGRKNAGRAIENTPPGSYRSINVGVEPVGAVSVACSQLLSLSGVVTPGTPTTGPSFGVPGETDLANDAFGLIGVVVSAVSADVM